MYTVGSKAARNCYLERTVQMSPTRSDPLRTQHVMQIKKKTDLSLFHAAWAQTVKVSPHNMRVIETLEKITLHNQEPEKLLPTCTAIQKK